MEAPPKEDSRKFNENDILGEFDRDQKGNLIPVSNTHTADKLFSSSHNPN